MRLTNIDCVVRIFLEFEDDIFPFIWEISLSSSELDSNARFENITGDARLFDVDEVEQ